MLDRLPILIGVTGHRDLREEDRAGLEDRVREILSEFRTQYPHTPLVLLSPLAEGADRLAARVALAEGARLIVPLPMRLALYEQDFQTPASRNEFQELLAKAEAVFEVPLVSGNTEEEVHKNSAARQKQYAQVGAVIVQQSLFLIALWDGVPSTNLGGTAHVVQFKLEGIPEPYGDLPSPLDFGQGGFVYHILTPRTSNPRPDGTPFRLRKLYPRESPELGQGAKRHFARIYARIDTFNWDAAHLTPSLAGGRAAGKAALFPSEPPAGLPASLQDLREHFALADSLAGYYQKNSYRTLFYLFVLVLLATVIFDLNSHFFKSPQGILLFLVVAGIAYGWYAWTSDKLHLAARRLVGKTSPWYTWARCRGDFQNKYQDYRALAEGLRVQFYWRLAGLPDSVAEYYLRKQRSELDWIRNAIRAWTFLTQPIAPGQPSTAEPTWAARGRLVLTYWIEDQQRWFAETARRDEDLQRTHLRWAKSLIGVGMVVSGWLVVLLLRPALAQVGGWTEDTLRELLFVLMGLAPFGAALFFTYIEKRALPEHIKQYKRMSLIFDRAAHRLREYLAAGNEPAARRVIRELGEEALVENADWVLLHRDRPLGLPKGRSLSPTSLIQDKL